MSPIAAGFTTLCCLGLPALVAFASSIGATFLTNDATLRPLLAATLLLTLAGSALTFRSHRNPATLIVTAIAAVMIYWPLYGPALGGHTEPQEAGHEDHGTSLWVIAELVLLVAAQAFDIWQLRRRRSPKPHRRKQLGEPR